MADTVTRLNAALEGRYAIERELGEGGMATVYLADDLKHERKVALKVLKPELAAVVGAERFLAEIKMTANLQHPHILPLFDSGEADSFLFYVMPYVEGETLQDRIDREKQLPVDEALGIATALANALQTAHEQGIVHRDIKPANILLSRDEPLIADFGIALAVGAAGGSRLTETGLSVGTPYYMSPEQATGDQAVGPASDTYALACVLYEMLVGEPPYLGNTAQAVLGKIIQGLPVSATAVRGSIPPNVDAAIRKALEKLPADRFTAAREFARALADPGFRYGESADPTGAAASVTGQRWRGVAAAMAVVAAGSFWVAARGALSPEPRPVLRMVMDFPAGEEPVLPASGTFAISRDGSQFVYQGPGDPSQIWIKRRDALHAQPLQGTDGGSVPIFSPDGTEIAFVQDGELKKMPAGGGPSITIAEGVNMGLRGAAWLDDGTLVYNSGNYQLWRASSAGGSTDMLVSNLDEVFGVNRGLAWPVPLPDARGVLFAGCTAGCADVDLFVLDLVTGEARTLVEESGKGWYTSTGHLVYVRTDGGVFAAPFDLEELELTGDAVPVLGGFSMWLGAGADVVMSDEGDLIYLEGQAGGASAQLVWLTPEGDEEPLDAEWQGVFATPALSPDGGAVAVAVNDGDQGDIWIKQLPSSPAARLTFEGSNQRPFWGPDGVTVSFLSDRAGDNLDVWRKPADGSANAELVLDLDEGIIGAGWSPDGEWLVFRTVGGGDILAIRPGVDTVPVPLSVTPAVERSPVVSPDGRWVAYTSDVTGIGEVYVRPFPESASGAQRQVSIGGGANPWWSPSGRQLSYNVSGMIRVAELSLEPSLAVGATTTLVQVTGGAYRIAATVRQYAVAPDLSRVLAIRAPGTTGESDARGRFVYVQNWLEELKGLVEN